MIRAAQVGLGWWGKTLVESVQGTSDTITFVSATSRTKTDDYLAFAKEQGLTYADSYEAILADPNVDAVILATPHSQHSAQVIAAALPAGPPPITRTSNSFTSFRVARAA